MINEFLNFSNRLKFNNIFCSFTYLKISSSDISDIFKVNDGSTLNNIFTNFLYPINS